MPSSPGEEARCPCTFIISLLHSVEIFHVVADDYNSRCFGDWDFGVIYASCICDAILFTVFRSIFYTILNLSVRLSIKQNINLERTLRLTGVWIVNFALFRKQQQTSSGIPTANACIENDYIIYEAG